MRISASQTNVVAEAPSIAVGALPLSILSPAPRRNGRLRVLLVEDDDGDVYLIQRALAANPRVGDVMVARDGVEAIDLIDRWSPAPDFAILDLHMPRKDGFALLREFAARPCIRFPSLVLSSSRAGADVYRAKKRGAAEFLTKPNSTERLKDALDEFISRLH